VKKGAVPKHLSRQKSTWHAQVECDGSFPVGRSFRHFRGSREHVRGRAQTRDASHWGVAGQKQYLHFRAFDLRRG